MSLIGTDGSAITKSDLTFHVSSNTIEIPFPENYPPTTFYLYQQRQVFPVLARIQFSFPSTIYVNEDVKVEDTMVIHAFYVYTHPSARQEEIMVSPVEHTLTKGLGKRLLCTAVHHALSSGLVSRNGSIHLEASGGKCIQEDVTRFMETWSEGEMDRLITQLQFKDYLPIEEMGNTVEEKAHALCHYLENQKLVSYYKQYGLQPIDQSDPYYTTMNGKISSILNTCGQEPGHLLGRKRYTYKIKSITKKRNTKRTHKPRQKSTKTNRYI